MAGNTHSETARIPDEARGWDAAQVDPRLSVLPWANGYRCVENYEIHAYVTTGGMGSVFRAHHRALRQDYALKFPKLSTPDARARFEREARAGARSSCDHLIHVVHLGRVGTLDFLVMEWVEGGSLKDRIGELPEGESLPLEETLRILRGVARALQVLHSDGIYHRDVKPANVMYSSKGVVKLADYGLISSDDSQDLTTADVWAGSPQYAAPEQKRGLSRAKAPADVYSLGATAFFLLTGKVPEGATPFAVPDVRLALAGVPAEVADFVCRCMLLEPAQRYSDGGAVVAALDELQRRLATRGQAAADGEGVGRRRRAVVLGAMGLVCTAVAAIWWGGDPGTPVQAPAEASPAPVTSAPIRAPGEPVVSEPSQPKRDVTPPSAPAPETPTKNPAQSQAPPAVQSVGVAGGQQAELSTSEGATTFVLGKVEYGESASLMLEIEVLQECDKLDIVPHEALCTSEGRSDGRWRVAVSNLAPETKAHLEVTPVGVGGRGMCHVVHFHVPCITPDLPPLRREKRDLAKPVVRYRLRLGMSGSVGGAIDLDHLFIAVREDLLCAETELMRGQFRQFLDDGDAFERSLAVAADYQLLLDALGIRSGVQGRRRLLTSDSMPAEADLPMPGLLPHEAVAFADWLTRRAGLQGLRCRLPSTEELRGIGNLNGNRAWSAPGLPPLPANAVANVGPEPPVPGPANESPQPGPPAAPESVWARPQGFLGLYHLGGNLAEMTIDETGIGGGPSAGSCLGGSYAGPARDMATGLAWIFRPASADRSVQTSNLGMPSLGCRLVIVPLSPNK